MRVGPIGHSTHRVMEPRMCLTHKVIPPGDAYKAAAMGWSNQSLYS